MASPPDVFGSTHWSVIAAAAGGESVAARQALAKLCADYWYPLYASLRRRGMEVEEAQELTQEFFSRQVVTCAVLKGVDSTRGRFRAWLLASLKHFVHNQWERRSAQKRGGGQGDVPLEALRGAEDRYLQDPSIRSTPETLYERAWALTVLGRAKDALGARYLAQGKAEHFEVLARFLPGGAGGSQEEAAGRLGKNANAVKVAVFRLRREFGQALREEILRTVCDPAEVDQELRHLIEALEE
jgi:DNA-directed RNA polymerase specialized sigma24 family protein